MEKPSFQKLGFLYFGQELDRLGGQTLMTFPRWFEPGLKLRYIGIMHSYMVTMHSLGYPLQR